MSKVVVVYHSGYGHTQRLAQSVAQGANAELITIDAEGNVPDSAWDSLAAADAIIFGSPTYMGTVSWQFKKFADATSKPWYTQAWKDKVFAGFTNSSNINGDKASTLAYLHVLAMQHGGIWAGLGQSYHNTLASKRSDPNYLAANVGLMGQTASDAPADKMDAGDLESARLFGQRVAEVAKKLRG
jgi:multimeric flavodoxin WrbA